MNIFYHHPTYN